MAKRDETTADKSDRRTSEYGVLETVVCGVIQIFEIVVVERIRA
jgi:hypothetical protein